MPGRRRVDDDDVVVDARASTTREDAEQLVDAGRRQVHQLGRADRGRQRLDADGRGDLVERRLRAARARAASARAASSSRTARFGGRAAERRAACRRPPARRTRRRANAPDRSTAAARAGRDPARASRSADRRGDGRLADAALAAEEQQRCAAKRLQGSRRRAARMARAGSAAAGGRCALDGLTTRPSWREPSALRQRRARSAPSAATPRGSLIASQRRCGRVRPRPSRRRIAADRARARRRDARSQTGHGPPVRQARD